MNFTGNWSAFLASLILPSSGFIFIQAFGFGLRALYFFL